MLRFTEAELAEMAAADAEIDRAPLTKEEYRLSTTLDREARLQRLDNRQRSIAAYQKAYREANREEIAAYQKAYREANREEIAARQKAYQKAYREANREEIAARQKAYREANREKYNAYMREYMQRRRLEKKYAQAYQGPADSAGR